MRTEHSAVLAWIDRMTKTSAFRSRRWLSRPLTAIALCALSVLWAAPAHAQINLGTYSMGEVYAQLPGPGVYAVDSGSPLPPGLSLRLDTPPFFPSNVPAGIIGLSTTTVRTTYNFNLIKDGVTTAYQLTITPLSIITYWNLPDAYVNEPFSYQLTGQNLSGPATWAQNGPWPAGLSLSSSGLISGSPSVSGSFNLGVTLSDGVDTVFRGINLNINDVHLTITGALADGSLPNATQNAPYSATFAASGGAGGYTFSSNSVPFGLTLDETTGALSGTPTSVGPWRFTVTATDANNVSNTKWVSLDVIGSPARLPSIAPYDGYMVDASFGVPYNRGISVGQGGRAPYTWSVGGLPAGLGIRWGAANTVYWVNPGDAEIHGTPLQMGTFPVTLTVTDADGVQATNTFTLKVKPLHLWSWMPNGLYGVPYNHSFYLVGGQLPYSVVQDGGQLPLGLTINSSALTVTGTPQEHGGFTTTLLFSDSGGNQLRLNQYPYIGDPTSTIQLWNNGDLGTISPGFYSNQLTACCVPSYAWSIVSGTPPPGLTLTAGGLLSGTVPSGASGTYQFVVRVEDGANSSNFAVRQFTVTVTPMNTVGSTFLPTGNVTQPYSVSLVVSGATGAVAWSLEPNQYLPPGLTLSSSGGISGTPTGPGQFNFQVRATDSAGHVLSRWYTIDIYPFGVNPPLDLPSLSTKYTPAVGQFTVSLAATGGQGPYHYSLSPGANVIPGLRVQDGQPLPTFFTSLTTGGILAVFTTPGDYSTSIRVTDSLGASFDKAVSFHVTPLQFLNFSPLPRAVVGAPYSFTLTPFGGTSYTFSATGLPDGLSIDASTGQIFGTPTTATPTTPAFPQITLTDLASLETLSWGFSLTVDPFDVAQGDLPQATVNSFYTQTLTAPGCGSPCTWTLVSGGLSGITLSSAGVLSGTPTGTNTGASLVVRASGPNGAAQKTLGLRVVSATPQSLAINTSSFSDTTIGNTPLFSLSAQGGTPPYTWSLASGTLPTGVRIQAANDLVSSTQIPGLSYLTGRFMETNVFNFTLRVTDAASNSVTRSYSWRVSGLTSQFNFLPLTTGGLVYNTPYSQPLLAIGGTGSYTWTAQSPMPPGLNLNSSTGLVSGTPTNTGSFSVPVQITDGTYTLLTNINFNIGSGTPLTLSFTNGTTLGPTALGSGVNFSMIPFGGTAPYTVTNDTPLPPGLALVPFTGTGQPAGSMSLTGTATTPGVYSFTMRVVDSAGNLGVRTFTWTVGNFGLIGQQLPNGSVGVFYSQALVSFGGAVTWALGNGSSMPQGLTLSPSGTISGIPGANGVYSFVAVGTSGGVSMSFTLSLTISGIAITSGDLPVAILNQPYTFSFTATGGGSLTWTASGLPFGLTMSTAGVLSGSAQNTGSFTVTVQVSGSGVATLTRRYALFVTQPNPSILDIPTAATQLADATLGTLYQNTLTANGGVPPYTFSVASGSLPPGLSLVIGSQAPIVTSPAATLLAGIPTALGSYTFDLMVADTLGAQTRRTYHLNVTPVGMANFPPTGVAGTPYSFQFAAFGGTAPYTFTMSPTSPTQDMLPPGITLTTGGLLAGMTSSTGVYRFKLRVQDSASNAVERIVTVNVFSPSGLQVTNLNPSTIAVGRGRSALTLSAFENTNPFATYAWSVVGGTLPPGMALITNANDPDVDFNTTLLAGQPTAAGDYVFTVRATNTGNPSDSADHRFSFHVTNVRLVAPAVDYHQSVEIPVGEVGSAYQFQFKVAGGVPPYSFAVSPFTPLPDTFTLSPTGLLTGTPGAIGNYSIAMLVTDSTGDTATLTAVLPTVLPGAPEPLLQFGDIDAPAVGAPFVFNLDLLRRGGQAPITWSVTGGALPAGLALVPAQNGLPARLEGVLAAAGTVDFTLTATDAAGQTISFAVQGELPDLGFSTLAAPPARVGQPYSLSLSPRGAAPPLTVSLDPTLDLPPGLTVSAGGLLSGTPTAAGTFVLGVTVSDGIGERIEKIYRIAVDNVAGEVPAADVQPNPIQVYYETGSPDPAPVPVAIGTTSGTLPFTASLEGAPWANLSASSGTTPGSVNLNITPSSLAVGTYVGFLGAAVGGAVNEFAMTPVYLTVANPPPCSYAVNPSFGTMQAAGGKGSIGLSTGANCTWTATTADAWISLLAGPNGPVVASINDTGSRTISFSAAPNPNPAARVGTITVNGAVFTLTQFGSACAFTISPADLSVSAAGGVAGIGITASAASCSWTASGLGASPASGTGNATVSVTVPPNPDPGSRVLNATIAGQTLTVTQAGIGCTVSLSGSGANHPSAGGTGAVTVTTPVGCGYNSTVGPNWISITSGASGSGSGTLVYSVSPNPATFSRSATLFIGGQPFLITQDALACSVTIDSTGLGSPYGSTGGTGTLGVVTNGPNCTWAASSDSPWAGVAPPSGTGSGTVFLNVAPNSGSPTARAGNLLVGGQTIPIAQAGVNCTYSLQSSTASVPGGGGAGSVGIVAPAACTWNAASNAAWLSIGSSGSAGSSNVPFIAQPNPTASPRVGTLTIAGLTYTVNQAPAPCTYSLDSSGVSVTAGGGTGQFTFGASASGCAADVKSYVNWVHVTASIVGTGGTAAYIVDSNPSGGARSGAVQVGNQVFTVTQTAADCAFSLNAYGKLFDKNGGLGSLFGSPSALGCTPDYGTSEPSFITLGTLTGPANNIFSLPYQVLPFPPPLTPYTRRGAITLGGQVFTVKQTSW